LIINYSATVQDVYSSFAKEIIQGCQRLDILAFCHGSQTQNSYRTWTPDWTPDTWGLKARIGWSVLGMDIRSYMAATESDESNFLAHLTFNASPGSHSIAYFSDSLDTLTASGLIWAEIIQEECVYKDERALGNLLRTFFEHNIKPIDSYPFVTKSQVLIILECLLLSRRPQIERNSEIQQHLQVLLDSTISAEIDPENKGKEHDVRTSSILPETFIWKESRNPWNKLFPMMKNAVFGTSLIITDKGEIGRPASPLVEVGDIVCILFGCAMPMVLHPVGDHFEVRGEIYVPGIMKGEAMTALYNGKVISREFELH
jgi:hypothetical protein